MAKTIKILSLFLLLAGGLVLTSGGDPSLRKTLSCDVDADGESCTSSCIANEVCDALSCPCEEVCAYSIQLFNIDNNSSGLTVCTGTNAPVIRGSFSVNGNPVMTNAVIPFNGSGLTPDQNLSPCIPVGSDIEITGGTTTGFIMASGPPCSENCADYTIDWTTVSASVDANCVLRIRVGVRASTNAAGFPRCHSCDNC